MSAVIVRTIDQRPAPGSMIKPGELIDVLDMALTLSDRRIYNLLIANAWDKIGDDTIHCIAKTDLRGNHEGGERLADGVVQKASFPGNTGNRYSFEGERTSRFGCYPDLIHA